MAITERLKEMKRLVLESYRLIGRNNYTDAEIDEICQKEKLSDAGLKELLSGYNAENMKNHSTITEFGYDLKNVISDMRELDYECLKVILFDENFEYIGQIQDTDYDLTSISKKTQDLVKDKVCKNNNCKYVIRVHNHPHASSANTDYNDDNAYEKGKKEYLEHGITLLDDCIITGYDFYSRIQ